MMSMLNQAAVEALCSATYLENYLDCMENLPDDLQRIVSQLRELDSATNDIMTDIAHHQEIYLNEGDGAKKQRALLQIQRGLIKSQEIGDEKLSLVGLIIEHIENRTRQLEQDLENLGISNKPRIDPTLGEGREDKEKKSDMKQSKPVPSMLPSPPLPVNIPVIAPVSPNIPMTTASIQTSTAAKATAAVAAAQSAAVAAVAASTSSTTAAESKSESAGNKVRRQRRQRTAEANTKEEEKQKEEEEKMQPKKKKKRKAKKTGDKSFEKTLVGEPIDPDEPTYCLCEQVSYGDMIGCDNDGCAIEWFHFNCVGLTNKPKGKWYCPKCRGDKASVKRADLK